MKKNLKNKKGITLIALVVTIIVLIILAGISISLLLSENGILTKAKEAKRDHTEKSIKEKVTIMMGEYAIERTINDKTLKNYLQEQENAGKIESIEESEEGTETIIVDGYQVTIEEETLEILEIGNAGPRPKISNIQILVVGEDETETEATEQGVIQGTPLKITFNVTFEEGLLIGVNKGKLEEGKVEYTTDGTETQVNFIVTGRIGEEEYLKTNKVILGKFYREAYLSDVVQVGDFVGYSAGNWTQEDINKVGSFYFGVNLPNSYEKFGGFKVGSSKDMTIKPDVQIGSKNLFSGGWRVLNINTDGTIKIIHAGTSESYYIPRSSNNVNGLQNTINIMSSLRDFSMYEDSSTNSVDTNFSVVGSAHIINKDEVLMTPKSLLGIGVEYLYNYEYKHNTYYTLAGIQAGGSYPIGLWLNTGIRMVLSLKPNIKVKANNGQTTHTSPETAWILSLDE